MSRVVSESRTGYRAAYEKGVIHRDMSVENILINNVINATKGNRGFIIDFDCAKAREAASLHEETFAVGFESHVQIALLNSRCVVYLGDSAIHLRRATVSSALRSY